MIYRRLLILVTVRVAERLEQIGEKVEMNGNHHYVHLHLHDIIESSLQKLGSQRKPWYERIVSLSGYDVRRQRDMVCDLPKQLENLADLDKWTVKRLERAKCDHIVPMVWEGLYVRVISL
jgi:hypothetical protein